MSNGLTYPEATPDECTWKAKLDDKLTIYYELCHPVQYIDRPMVLQVVPGIDCHHAYVNDSLVASVPTLDEAKYRAAIHAQNALFEANISLNDVMGYIAYRPPVKYE